MLLKAIRKEKENIRLEGKLEGKAEGIAEGRTEALQNKAVKLLSKKFGSVSAELEEKIRNCSEMEQLDQIIDNIFDLTSLAEVEKIFAKK